MEVRIPFAYESEVIMKRSNKIRNAVFTETVEFVLPEISADDAPVALSMGVRNGSQRNYRYYEGRFLETSPYGRENIITPDGLAPSEDYPKPRQQMMTAYLARGQHKPIVDSINAWYLNKTLEGERYPDIKNVAEMLRSGKSKALGLASRLAEGMVVIDGVVWFPVAEPKIAFASVMTHTATVVSLPCDYHDRSSMWGDPVDAPLYNMNELEEALVKAAEHPTIHWSLPPGLIQVTMPEAFTFDRSRHAAEWAVNMAIDEVSKDIKGMPDYVVEKWMNARRASMQSAVIQGSEDAMIAAAAELAPHVRSAAKAIHLEAVIDVWNDGRITLDIVSPSGPRI